MEADRYASRYMYRSVFRMGIPRPWLVPSQNRTYNCEKERTCSWMPTPQSAGLSNHDIRYTNILERVQ
jgi:hypothetical protein